MNYDKLFSDLYSQGFFVQEHAFSSAFCHELITDLCHLEVKAAGVGAKKEVNPAIRQDKIKWLEGTESSAVSEYFRKIQDLQQALKEKTYLPLVGFECHYARYDTGGFYKPHYDNVQGKNNRLLTAILYLNETWCEQHGGELVAYPSENNIFKVKPKAGTFLIFDSAALLHEVQPAFATRQSITGWMTR